MENIIFDFDGVLIDWNPDYVYLEYFNNDKNKLQEFYNTTQIKHHNKELDRGIPYDKVLNELAAQHPQHAEAIKLWKPRWHKMLGKPIEGSVTILHKLHDNGYSLYGLTNWAAETFPYAYYSHEFFHIFKDIVVSGRENTIKPENKIYEICLSRNNLNAHECIFIDDSLDNVIAARNLGITAIHFTDPENLQTDLINLGVKI